MTNHPIHPIDQNPDTVHLYGFIARPLFSRQPVFHAIAPFLDSMAQAMGGMNGRLFWKMKRRMSGISAIRLYAVIHFYLLRLLLSVSVIGMVSCLSLRSTTMLMV